MKNLFSYMRDLPVFGAAAVVLALLCFGFASQARAAQNLCSTPYETITTLRPPVFGIPPVWDARYAPAGTMVALVSGVPREDGSIMAAGIRYKDDAGQPDEIVLVALNRRGRALVEVAHKAKPYEQPVKMIAHKGQYIVISTIGNGESRPRQARIAWYSMSGRYLRDRLVGEAGFDYKAMAIKEKPDGAGLLAVFEAVSRDGRDYSHAVVMQLDGNGRTMWERSYETGFSNRLRDLSYMGDGTYVAVGESRMEDGRHAGWIVQIAADGTLQWQQVYPRGAGASLYSAVRPSAQLDDRRGFLVSGRTDPLDGGGAAAWVMALDESGTPQWQRFIRSAGYGFAESWIRTHQDGRISLAVNARAQSGVPGARDHIRMLSFAPQALLLTDEAYYAGIGARAGDILSGRNDARVAVAGLVDDRDLRAARAEEQPVRVVGLLPERDSALAPHEEDEIAMAQNPVDEGWILYATPLDPYDDPCAGYAP